MGADLPPKTTDPPTAEAPDAERPRLDAKGRFLARGTYSVVTVAVYAVIVLVLYFVVRPSPIDSNPWFVYLLMAGTVFLLLRYFSTNYVIDDTNLVARRILGSRRIPLQEVRKIEYIALRDLSPTGFFGSWGYRGRMWSPYISSFDAIYTDPVGLLITGGPYPLFISPEDREGFARELSRRVRSYSGPLTVDVGAPAGSPTYDL